jgi:hypothetical protein
MTQVRRETSWWKELFWGLYDCLPVEVDRILSLRQPYVQLLKNLSVPVSILRGPTHLEGSEGTVIAAGPETQILYFIPHFFQKKPNWERIGNIPLWNLPRALQSMRSTADLTVIHTDRLSARFLFGADYLAVPEWVGSMLEVPGDISELSRGNPGLKSDLRAVRLNNFTSDITYSDSDFDFFYSNMYVPFTLKRYGEQSKIENYYKLRRCSRNGGLLWARQNDKPVAGGVFQRAEATLRFLVLATLDGDWQIVKRGGIAALYLFIIRHAKELGFSLVDFGGSRPSLNDGLLRYKRKWKMKIVENEYVYHDFLVYWNRLSDPVFSFLSSSPLIFRDKNGLSAIKAVTSDEPITQGELEKINRAIASPGLNRMCLAATKGWQEGIDGLPKTHLLEAGQSLRDCSPNALFASIQQTE